MTYYEGLPIYKAAMDLVVRLDQAALHFPKRHKFGIGVRLVDTATEVLLSIARAQRRGLREQALDRLSAGEPREHRARGAREPLLPRCREAAHLT